MHDMVNNYVVYHLHTDDSLLDSCTKYNDYVDKAVELGQKAIAFTEHGNIYNWIHKKLYCDEKGIKYLHGVECYLTETLAEKVRDNYHTILIAKNYDGVLEINTLVSKSSQEDHFYHKPRISFDEFLHISDNVIKISACLGSPLNHLNISNPYYGALARHYDYYEIQPHDCSDQIAYNIHLAQLAKKYKKPLIAGTDTHSLNSYKAECRSILMKAKKIGFSNEDEFDLTYHSFDELVDLFEAQESMPKELWLEAINNTNVMADSVEEFELDTSFKYPIMYDSYEKDAEMYHNRLKQKLNEKIDRGIIPLEQIDAFYDALDEEARVFKKVNMLGFMLSMSEFVCWAKDNGIPVGFNRGSCGGSRAAYALDITDMNPETWHTVFSRFCNEDRKEIGKIFANVYGNVLEKLYLLNCWKTLKVASPQRKDEIRLSVTATKVKRRCDMVYG